MPRKPATKQKLLKVRAAAKLIGMTPAGVYVAIKRGDIASKLVDGKIHVPRDSAMAHRRRMRELMKPKDPNRPLTDEEFLQALWDSDPDD